MNERIEELLEKEICMNLHFKGIPQKQIGLFLGKSITYVNKILKPLGKRSGTEEE
jgi:hypothetical protein